MKLQDKIYTKDDILCQLTKMNIPRDRAVLMHSSLRSVGRVEGGAITDGFIGNAPTQCCDARIMKDVMEIILKNCEGADPLADEKSLPPKWYC